MPGAAIGNRWDILMARSQFTGKLDKISKLVASALGLILLCHPNPH